MSLFLIILGSILLADVLWWWRGDRWLRPLPRPRLWRALFLAFMALQLGGFLYLIASRLLELPWKLPTPLLVVLFVWHLLILGVLIIGWSLGGGITTVVRLVRRLFQSEPTTAPPSPEQDSRLTRRQLLGAALAAVPPMLTIGSVPAALAQLDSFRIRRLTLSFADLPGRLDGLTIAHVSDTHVGRLTHGSVLNKIVNAVNDLDADLVCFTGDLINDSLNDLPAAVAMAAAMKSRHATVLCEGNHDLFESRSGFEAGVRKAGLPILLNESRVIDLHGQPVQLMGMMWGRPDTPTAHRSRGPADVWINRSMQTLMSQRVPGAFPILLAHHPHAFDAAAEAGIPLTLAGHTHGGQLHLSPSIGFGPMMYRYWSGPYTRDGRHLVVSNGVGNWFPLRLNAPAEVIHLTLKRA